MFDQNEHSIGEDVGQEVINAIANLNTSVHSKDQPPSDRAKDLSEQHHNGEEEVDGVYYTFLSLEPFSHLEILLLLGEKYLFQCHFFFSAYQVNQTYELEENVEINPVAQYPLDLD